MTHHSSTASIQAVPLQPIPIPPGEMSKGIARSRPIHQRFGFRRDPFPVVPDPSGFFLPPGNEILLTEVLHSIESRRGFLVVTGEVGLGKTTLSRRILAELEERGIQTSLILNTFYQGVELLQEINRDFGLRARSKDLPTQMGVLNAFLLDHLAEGTHCAIVIDDAQQLSVESLELLRQISNLETDEEKLVQILLVGQPELNVTLRAFELRQLDSRIALRCTLLPYTLEETEQYVGLKLGQTEGEPLQVSDSAFRWLFRLSGGNPRRINLLMDRCLYACIAFGKEKVDSSLLTETARDLGLMPASGSKSRSVRWALVLFLVLTSAWLLRDFIPLQTVSEWEDQLIAARASQAREQIAPTERVPRVSESARTLGLKEPKPLGPESLATGVLGPGASQAGSAIKATDEHGRNRADEIHAFLAAYELQQHTDALEASLAAGFTDEVAATIRLATGLRLISLPAESTAGIKGYQILELQDAEGRGNRHLLFWRPATWNLRQLYFRYEHGEVLALQRALRALGFYRGELDGLAGPLTSMALRGFQTSVSLPPSGMPDPATLFLLEELSPTRESSVSTENPAPAESNEAFSGRFESPRSSHE